MPDDTPTMPAGHAFHHIGYACTTITRERSVLEAMGYRLEQAAFSDPVQGVHGCFMVGAGPRIELLENLPGSDTLTPWLSAGIKMYHLAYEVNDIHATLAWARGRRGIVKVRPVAAVAFGGRLIAFVFFRNGLLTEFIEAERGSGAQGVEAITGDADDLL